ncbi:hypothetical protein J5N97_022749 [Dioscorea zingiberensis]|uniref:Universal stress protein n=1 Tax=Dioscorea zingiberensis TaxID=325984 RepID=A0A9D5HB44_9LILI|nr:hypothetical protein J5N97_022749 [Dioscorea zingiberensis]
MPMAQGAPEASLSRKQSFKRITGRKHVRGNWKFVSIAMGYCSDAWNGFSWGAFRELGAFTRLSIASGIMMCLEMWFCTILIMLVRQLPNPKIAAAAMSICINLLGWEMMVFFGFNAAISYCCVIVHELYAGQQEEVVIGEDGTKELIGDYVDSDSEIFVDESESYIHSTATIHHQNVSPSPFRAFVSALLEAVRSASSEKRGGVTFSASHQRFSQAAMAFAQCSIRVPLSSPRAPLADRPISPLGFNRLSFSLPSSKRRGSMLTSAFRRTLYRATAEIHESGGSSAADAFANVKHLLLPVTDQNPYLSEGTRQAAATTTALAKKYGADITVVVIDDKPKESIPEHDTLLSSIRWHLSEGGFQEFGLMERLGDGKKPTTIIGEVADDLNLDLVVLSMEAIHSKHVDANLLAEFIPCPVLLLPL